MSDIYDAYSTITSASVVAHQEEVARTAAQFRRVLLPILWREGLGLDRASVLEFGAGWGKNLLALRALGAKTVQGVDISAEQVGLGRSFGLEGLRVIAPDEDLSGASGGETFHLVLAMDVLEHLSLQLIEQFARAVQRVLRPGGLLAVQVPNDLAPLSPVRAGDLTHLRTFTGESVVQFLRLCQLDPVLVRGVAFPGAGAVYLGRTAVTRWILGPLFIAVGRILYGRADAYGIYEPNIFAIGKRKGAG